MLNAVQMRYMDIRRLFPSEDIPVFEFYIIDMVGILEGIVVEMNHRR